MLLGCRVVQLAAEVGEHDPGLPRRVVGGHRPGDVAEEVRLPGLAVAEHQQVGGDVEVVPQRGQVHIVQAQRHPHLGLRPVGLGPRQVPGRHGRRQHPHRRRLGHAGHREGVHQVEGGVGQVVGAGPAVHPRQRRQVVHRVRRDATSGDGGHLGGDLAADLGVHRVAQPQLEPGAEHVPQPGPHLRPPRRGHHEVDAEGQTPRGDLPEPVLQLLELLPDGVPAVDDQEHVPVGVLLDQPPLPAGPPVVGDRVDVVRLEQQLPPFQQRRHLHHGAADPVPVEPVRHATHVREARERGQGATAEVQAVELHLGGVVHEAEPGDHGAQHGALPALRPAHHGHVPRRTRQVGGQQVAALLLGEVDQRHRRVQRAHQRRVGHHQAAPRLLQQGRQQLVEGGGAAQRRQPHLVGAWPEPAQPVDEHVQHAQPGLLRARLPLRGEFLLADQPFRPHLRCQVARFEGVQLLLDDLPAVLATAGPVRTGDVGALEPLQGVGVAAQVAVARGGGQLVGVGHADNRAALHRRERAQTDPVGQVRLDLGDAALVQALGGQQQVHAQASAETSDGGEHVDEVGLAHQHLAELVDHDEQGRQRFEGDPVAPGLFVVAAGRVVARRPQQLLPPGHLPGQRVRHPVDQFQLVDEVGDDGRRVG